MAKADRFISVYEQTTLTTFTRILVDKETGVNYLVSSHASGNGLATGLTVMVDENGKPLVTKNLD